MEQPSFFEMIAQDRLLVSLKPALKHCIVVFSRWYPRFASLQQYHTEYFYALLYFLESHHLKVYGGTFAENFYGLKRVLHRLLPSPSPSSLPSSPSASPPPLPSLSSSADMSRSSSSSSPSSSSSSSAASSPSASSPSSSKSAGNTDDLCRLHAQDRNWALFFLIGIPYVKDKLDAIYERLSNADLDEDGFENLQRPELSSATNRFIALYPYCHAVYEAVFLVYQLMYLFNKTRYFTPFFHFLGQQTQRLSMKDIRTIQEHGRLYPTRNHNQPMTEAWQQSSSWRIVDRIRQLIGSIEYFMADKAKIIILGGIFFFKFLEWWYSPANERQRQRVLPVPPPPRVAKTASSLRQPADKTLCGLCKGKRTNPACTLTGYVFCYACIFNYIRLHQRCPITNVACSVEQIRKIY